MRIAELARRAGVKISTVRFYERSGMLAEPERTAGGYRDYHESDALQLRFIRRGLELGFSLAELDDFTHFSRAARAGTVPAGEVTAAAEHKIHELDGKISDLQRTRSAIVGLLEQQCIDISAPCPIVTALAAQHPAAPGRTSRQTSRQTRQTIEMGDQRND